VLANTAVIFFQGSSNSGKNLTLHKNLVRTFREKDPVTVFGIVFLLVLIVNHLAFFVQIHITIYAILYLIKSLENILNKLKKYAVNGQ
jgi:hypothetical protein